MKKFKDSLKELMKELNISQAQLASLTGISKSSISLYLSGDNEPRGQRKEAIATALGVDKGYFDSDKPVIKIETDESASLSVKAAAKLMGKSSQWIMQGLRDGVFPFGYAVKLKEWSYWISAAKFTEYTGIAIPKITA